MTTRTRYFVIVSLLVLAIGLGIGWVAYYSGLATNASGPLGGPDELKYVPRTAALLAYADVNEIMASEVRQRLRRLIAPGDDGRHEFEEKTGINIETDIDYVVVSLVPGLDPASALVLARGRFDAVKIEALMREHGGRVEDYRGVRVIVADRSANTQADPSAPDDPAATPRSRQSHSVAFVEPGLVAVGHSTLVRSAIDHKNGGDSVALNEEMMKFVRALERDSAWVVGRFDALASQARLPDGVAAQIPAITWVSGSVDVNGGVRGVLRAETRDEPSATNLRDVVRGFLALAKLQSRAHPQIQAAVDSLQLSGTGTTVVLGFDLPSEFFDILSGGAAANPAP
jgi:hypothetical protein